MSISYPSGYYDRYDASKNYDKHLFRADYVLQSAELNEVQSNAFARAKGIGDALFKDGAIVRGCEIVLDGTNCTLGSGIMYLAGAMRGIPSGSLTVAATGTKVIGVYLTNTIVGPADDAALRDPAVGVLNFAEPGAYRLRRDPTWGIEGVDAPTDADFFPVYTAIDGEVQPHTPPPQIEAVNLAIARYDVQSSGSNYVTRGMDVRWLPDDGNGNEVFSISEGIARINGYEIDLTHAKRVTYTAEPDLNTVSAESHARTSDPQTITVNHDPVDSVTLIIITRQIVEETVTRGDVPGGTDFLAHTSVLSVSEVKQGATTYVEGNDYALNDDGIDWSPGGAEPATGSTYKVTYRYTATYPEEPDILSGFTDTTVTVAHAASGTTIMIGYKWKMPRYDRMCMTPTGAITFATGISHPTTPIRPRVPRDAMLLATIYQTWNADTRYLVMDATKMVPMYKLANMEQRIDDLFNLVGDCRLAVVAVASDPAAKKGLFVDGFRNNAMRDLGFPQDAACANKTLTLAIDVTVHDVDLGTDRTLTQSAANPFIQQTLFTGSSPVNPYMSFAPSAFMTLVPSVDQWTEIINVTTPRADDPQRYGSLRFYPLDVAAALNEYAKIAALYPTSQTGVGFVPMETAKAWLQRDNGLMESWAQAFGGGEPAKNQTESVVNTSESTAEFLRPITVKIEIAGFGAGSPGEALSTLTFDGLTVVARAAP